MTHALLLLPALLAVAVGIADLRAAERRAAHGGGLLCAIGLIPLVLGGCLTVCLSSGQGRGFSRGRK